MVRKQLVQMSRQSNAHLLLHGLMAGALLPVGVCVECMIYFK
jgi:hypothetical protein